MSEKITSSSSSSLSQYKKTGRKKPLSGDNQKGKVAAEVKRDTSCPESGSAGEQVNYSPPVRDDNLNISNEAIHFMDGEGKGSEATLNEIMEKIFTQPEIDGKSSGKVELFLSAMKEGNDEKADISTLMEGTYEEIEIGKNAFRKLSGAGERNRDGDKTQCVSYDRPEMGKEDVYSLWDGEVSASGSASPEKEEKIPRTTDRERLHRESHNIMKKLDGRDRAEEETDTVMGGRTYKKYSTSEKDVDGGKEISFKENHETAYKDKEGNVKKDTSSSLITRNPDGSYNKVYERTDGDGNKYNTELKTNSDGSSERISRTLLNDGTEITSSETEDKEGRKKIISEETRPDGSKIYKERIVDEKGKGKVVMRETKPEGRTLNSTADGSEKEKKSAGIEISIDKKEGVHVEIELGGGPMPVDIKVSGDLKPEDLSGVKQAASSGKKDGRGENSTDYKVQVKAGATAGVNRGEQLPGLQPENNIEGTLKPASIKEQQVKSVGGSSANIPSDLKGAYNYFDKYFPEEAEDMKEMSGEGKLNILTQKEAEKILPAFGKMGDGEGLAMPSSDGQGIISIKLQTDLSDKEIAANMRHEYWHAKFNEYSGIKSSDLEDANPASICIHTIQETFCYKKEIEAKEKMGLNTEKARELYDKNKKLMENLEIYLDLREKLEKKEIDAIPKEYEGTHKS